MPNECRNLSIENEYFDYTFFSYKNMIFRSEPWKEIEIATNNITTMFLYFGKSELQCSYKHGSYKKK